MGDKRVSGAAKKVRGSITEALGKLTGDKATENQGTVQKEEAEAELKAEEVNKVTTKKVIKRKPIR